MNEGTKKRKGNVINQIKADVKEFNQKVEDFNAKLADLDEKIKAAGDYYADYDPEVISVSLEEFYNSSLVSSYEFEGKDFDDLDQSQIARLQEMFRHECEMNPREINAIAKARLEKEREALVDAFKQEVEDSVHRNKMYAEELDRHESKAKSEISDIEYELEKATKERNKPETSFERAQELNTLISKLNDELEKANNKLKFIDLAKNSSKDYKNTLDEIGIKLGTSEFTLENNKEELDKIENISEKLDEKVKPVEEIKEEVKEEVEEETKEDAKEETEEVVEEEKQENTEEETKENSIEMNDILNQLAEERARREAAERRVAELEARNRELEEQLGNEVDNDMVFDAKSKQEYLYVKGYRDASLKKAFGTSFAIAVAGVGLGFFGGPVVAAGTLAAIGAGTALPTIGRVALDNINRIRNRKKLKRIAKMCGRKNDSDNPLEHFDVKVQVDAENEKVNLVIRDGEEYRPLTDADAENIRYMAEVDIQEELDKAFNNEDRLKNGDMPVTLDNLYLPFAINGGVLGPIEAKARNAAIVAGKVNDFLNINEPDHEYEEANVNELENLEEPIVEEVQEEAVEPVEEAEEIIENLNIEEPVQEQVPEELVEDVPEINIPEPEVEPEVLPEPEMEPEVLEEPIIVPGLEDAPEIDAPIVQEPVVEEPIVLEEPTVPEEVPVVEAPEILEEPVQEQVEVQPEEMAFADAAVEDIQNERENIEDTLNSAYQKMYENLQAGDMKHIITSEEFEIARNFTENVKDALANNPGFELTDEIKSYLQVFAPDEYDNIVSNGMSM